MKIAFLGTPSFAVPSLEMLAESGHKICVFTQPDRPKGRGHGITMPPVKEFALKKGLPVFQFEKIRSAEGIEALKDFAPDLMVTAAFGQLLSQENLDIPKYGCINVHGSLLPKYRGAAPIQQAVIDGEKITGVTTMMTDIGMDTGDILLRKQTEIGENETFGELYDRLAVLGAELLSETINKLIDGTLERIPQNESEATKCGKIKKEDALIDFSKPAVQIHNLVRGLNPEPSSYALMNGQNVKIFETVLHPEMQGFNEAVNGECVIASAKKGLFVKTGDGIIEISALQFPSSKRMAAKAALNSRKLLGEIFNG